MHQVWVYTLASVLAVSLISLIGIFALKIEKKKSMHTLLIYLISFSAGALLGDVFLHLLPELVEGSSLSVKSSITILSGILIFFTIEKVVHWQHCHMPASKEHIHPFAIVNLVGDGVHNFIDGLIIGASYLVSIPVGIATTLAVLIHEIPQEIGDFGVLVHGGFSIKKALFFNFISAFVSVLGAVLSLSLAQYIPNITSILIPIAIGGFIYIAGSDLIPELHKEFETRKALLEILSLILGIVVMAALLLLG